MNNTVAKCQEITAASCDTDFDLYQHEKKLMLSNVYCAENVYNTFYSINAVFVTVSQLHSV
jgi:hypothetical protein